MSTEAKAASIIPVTDRLASFTAELRTDRLAAEVRDRIHLLILDLVGSIIRARHESESTPALLAAASDLGITRGDAHVFSDPSGYSPAAAALLNAALAHSLDFDDTHGAAIVHAGAPIIPAALAAAEMTGAPGADVVAGIVAGFEVALRLSLALPAGAHYDRGFHPSATCGAFGAATAASRVFGLDAERTASAFGTALSQTAGSLQFLANGAWTKRFQVGWASMAGLTAASLARHGFRGASQPLEGRHGFLRSYGGPAPDFARAVSSLGATYELMDSGIKPYPSCRWGHAGIDAALALRIEHRLRAEDIESARLGVSRSAMLLIGEPAEKKASPDNIVDAQFSGPFVIAAALATGSVTWDSYALLSDPVVRTLTRRISCYHEPEIEAELPARMAALLTVETRAGTLTRKVRSPKGDPENFLTVDELRAKFTGLAAGILGEENASALADSILRLEHLPNVAGLFPRPAAI